MIMAGYSGGRIKKIRLHNFMTYDNVVLYPKKGLNLIIGLNGTGKSSMMCAICLGLAGKLQVTGRAKQMSGYIKHGCQEAEIEIELESGDSSILICRRIKGDKCDWFLNHALSNQNEVADTVKGLNIDTSNLCQFLPQEKVLEFSQMDKKQRLENMMQAIGVPRLFELFNELKDLYKESSEIQLEIKKCEIKKKSTEEENERISDVVKKQESRVRLKLELDELRKQKLILEYVILCKEVEQLKIQRNERKMELNAFKDDQKEAIALETSIFDSYMKYSNNQQNFKSQKKNLTDKITKASSVLSDLTEKVENVNIDYRNRLREVESDRKKLHNVNIQIAGLEQSLNEMLNQEREFKERNKANSQSLSSLQREINSLHQKKEELAAENNKFDYSIAYHHRELTSLQNEHNKKMENLKKRDHSTYQAACWLLENRHIFKSQIYLPIMLEIKVHSSENSKYIENSIQFRDMIAFICEDKSDCEKFTDILAQKQLPVNVAMPPETPLSHFVSPPLTPEYKQCGLQCYLTELFTAPDAIMRYLCACYRIHSTPVAMKPVPAQKMEFILQKYIKFFSENNRISGIRSRYGSRNWSVKKDFIVEQNLLTFHNDELQTSVQQKLQTLQEQKLLIVRNIENLDSNLNDKEKDQEELRKEKKHIVDWQKKYERLKSDYNNKQRVRDNKSVLFNEKEENVIVARKIRSINDHRDDTLRELNSLFKEFISMEKEMMKLILCINCLSKSLKLTKASNEDVHEKVKVAEARVEAASNLYKEKKQSGHRMYALIESLVKKKCNNEEKDVTIEELEMKINHIQAQLNVDEDNEPVVADYNARRRQIEAFQKDLDHFRSRLEELKEKIETGKKEWLKPLLKHIGNINRKFSNYFKQLSCAGEISLDIPDNPDDFAKYGLQIKLKFHDEPLTELSPSHHSGGECSVAAIVFILSLQELTEVPFRCIDEINQGMDAVNERKIFQLISDSVCEERCSQYFLLTPKLLMDLEYPANAAVHVIYNSCYLNINLDVKRHLEIAASTST